jgi:hypothetical protein
MVGVVPHEILPLRDSERFRAKLADIGPKSRESNAKPYDSRTKTHDGSAISADFPRRIVVRPIMPGIVQSPRRKSAVFVQKACNFVKKSGKIAAISCDFVRLSCQSAQYRAVSCKGGFAQGLAIAVQANPMAQRFRRVQDLRKCMKQLIARLERLSNVRVEQGAETWTVLIDKAQFSFNLTIPFEVLEWSVAVHDAAGKLLWQDWGDYRGYSSDENLPGLAVEMGADIVRFVTRALTAENFRVVETGKLFTRRTAQWQQGGQWDDVWVLN